MIELFSDNDREPFTQQALPIAVSNEIVCHYDLQPNDEGSLPRYTPDSPLGSKALSFTFDHPQLIPYAGAKADYQTTARFKFFDGLTTFE